MRHITIAACLLLGGVLHAQIPIITSVTNESGSTSLCPGGVTFIRGTNLGGASAIVTVSSTQPGTTQAYVFSFNSSAGSLQLELPVNAPLGNVKIKVGNSAPFNVILGPYAPAIPTDGLADALANVVHYPSGVPVTAAFPASPNEQIAVLASGLGSTTPVFATGTSPNDNSAIANALPTVSVAGKPATVSTAFLAQNSPGFYEVVITVPATTTTGNQNISLSIGGLASNTASLPVTAGPVVGLVTSLASYINESLPNGPIAQGSIFSLTGNNLGPSVASTATPPFQSNSLGQTSVSVTVNGTTVAAPLASTSAGQVIALLPSNTPVGTGTVTVTYNNQVGNAHPITVVANNVGIFTITLDGQGAGIVTYDDYSLVSGAKAANCGGPGTNCGAANPGDVLTIWATGLGPASIDGPAGFGVNMLGIPLTILLGGVPIQASYQGRSGCCVGEDQIVFTVPANAPTGCAVPLAIQINNFISNSTALPVAAGSRTCTPSSPGFTAANVLQVSSSGAASFTYGGVGLNRRDNYPAGFQDVVTGEFSRFSVPQALQPYFFTYTDKPALGSCQIFNNNNGNAENPITLVGGLDAGPQLTVKGPNGMQNVAYVAGSYSATLSANGTYLSPGIFTVSGTGGADVPAFSTSITVPVMPIMTSPPPDAANAFTVTRANGLTVTWTGGQPNELIELDVYNATDNTFRNGASLQCEAPAANGTFTIPASALLALPAGNFGGMDFRPSVSAPNLTGTGLNVTQFGVTYDNSTPLTFK